MRVLVTGAGGHLGSAIVPELLANGHQVVGLARSERAAAVVRATGADVRRGDVNQLDPAVVAEVDAVIHLAYDHEAVMAGEYAAAATADLAVVRAFGDALAGTGKTFIGIGLGGVEHPRAAIANEILTFADRGVRPLLIAVPQVVHSELDRGGFVPTLIGIARATGVSGYVGATRWPAVHTLDVARLYRLALEQAPSGSQLSAAADEGVAVRDIATVIGRRLGVPTVEIPAAEAAQHFGGFAPLLSFDNPTSSAATRELLGWKPERPDLLTDLESGHYFGSGRDGDDVGR
ncbi:NAD-dependent epimerase/dehydratase family protein [Kribbella sandramycini]|uniref:NAD-dependent epimerase/dehydratase family protein n=1 Tax=Kribbella sandramycini TaxID=60450 RepID=A0A7Y4NXD2_9ACTN|nr:NAD-dependent epimerase/dehydratase family protein [Kribbella sandramycini]MBB6567630.1 nucleoside-diphosphate-sugar epimerase [Kribbella sandramycini]NOL39767.1 NAD-dependent epimerase/dehydratase family protein [Kribbella sandramycini]